MHSNDPEASAIKRNFGGWKLDLIMALNSDASLKPSEISVAVALIKHLSVATFDCFPSQETLAEITHMSVRHVDNCLKGLKAAGYLSWTRGRQHEPSRYSFDALKVGQEIARMKQDDQDRRSRNRDRPKPSRPEPQFRSGRHSDLNRSSNQT